MVLLASGCATTEGQSDIGKVGGAAAGAALGSLVGGGRGTTLAMVGGALLGGYAGNELYDRPREAEYRANQDAQRQREYEEKLAYERQSQLQHAKVQQEIQEQHMYEQWRREQTGHDSSLSNDEVSRAQRLLRGLGYYNGKVDGVVGSGTTSAVKAYQRDNGLKVNGQITPSLISSMQAQI
jgi:uncharacterized protein YcfJ